MRIKPGTLILASAALAAVALTSIPAMAKSRVRLTVPFDFTVQGKALPAGQYTVTRDEAGSMVKLESLDASKSFAWFVHTGDANVSKVALRFEVNGDNHALQSIQCGTMETSRLTKKARKGEDVSPLDISGQ